MFHVLSNRRIWLFIDRPDRADDNAEHLWLYSLQKNDGIDKYFILSEDCDDYQRLKQFGNVVTYMSQEHLLLMMFAERLITSHNDYPVLYPYSIKTRKLLSGFFNYDAVFLQHGNIADDLSSSLNRLAKNWKIFIVSSQNEYDSILHFDYGYDERVVKLTGLARYDKLLRLSEELQKEKWIVYTPTWRADLSEDFDVYNPLFKSSVYCCMISELLSDEELMTEIENHGYKFVFRPHPRVACQLEDFVISDRVKVITEKDILYQEMLVKSSVLISDYSSIVYDFALLQRPVIYYQFDASHCANGLFDRYANGFGPVVTDKTALIETISGLIGADCKQPGEYRQRVDMFFKYRDDKHCERTYEAVLEIGGNRKAEAV
jgi:CDP-glycerol glycerophosphotransferase (TagB/SpsB family)